MLVLHNPHDKASRDFVENHTGPEDIIWDWYDPTQQRAWVEAGGTLEISAFPSVIVGEAQHVIRSPETLSEVEERVAEINETLGKSGDADKLISKDTAPVAVLELVGPQKG